MKLSIADKRILKLAIEEARVVWEQAARNYGVVARAPEGSWAGSPVQAAKKQRALERRLDALNATATKLGFD